MVTFAESYQVSCVDNEDAHGREAEDSNEECDSSSSSSEEEEESGAVVLVDDIAKSKPSFGNVTVSNSSDVHFGNKTFYQGPVTIKQIVYAKNGRNETLTSDDGSVLRDDRLILDCAQIGEEKFNEGFVNDEQDKNKVCGQNGRVVGGAYQPQGLDSDGANGTLPNNVRIISRLEWVAQPPVQTPNELTLPVSYVIIWHTATENCSDQAACILHVRTIQTFHIDSRHWWDIAYNFLVGGDGNAYEGRGWTKEGSHTHGYNKNSIGIAFIGTFITVKPPERQLNACKAVIDMGVKQGYIAKDYKLLAAKQLIGTQAPGAVLYEEIKTWPHWSALP
ncbi:peptidoglycan recognition protein isoform X2 [Agrilus planipennis]|uniref:Peptidoglycan recognition protein isoform X2 n=1 Tax=Agrilus planipennis TaxID=224129 RepID=A0A7F5R3T8_AGRPL|nr:peptidoglycan recognition protein isoform X2 [Agrilus planipennis]